MEIADSNISGSPRFAGQDRKAAAFLVVFIALFANLGVFLAARTEADHTTLCSASYLTLGQNLLQGRGFVNATGLPESRHTPGYPLFIAAVLSVFKRYEGVIFVQHLLISLLALAVFRFTHKATGNLPLATIAGALLGADIATVWVSNQIMAEALFTSVIFGVTLLTWKAAGSSRPVLLAAATGFALGTAILIKPIAVLYAIPMALYLVMFGSKAKFRSALVLLVSASLLPGIWMVRNQRLKGVATISSIAGENMLAWRAAGAVAISGEERLFPYAPVPLPDEDFVRRFYRETQPGLNLMAQRELEATYGARASELNDAQRSVIQGRLGTRILLQNPLNALRVAVYGVLHVMFDGAWEAAQSLTDALAREPVMYLLFIFSALSALLAFLGMVRMFREQRRLFWLILFCVGYFVGMSTGMEAESRFRVPFTPLYSLAVAQGTLVIISRLASIRQRLRRGQLHSAVTDTGFETAKDNR